MADTRFVPPSCASLPTKCNIGDLITLTGTGLYLCTAADTWALVEAGTGSGNVVGPASSTDNAIARFDSTTGKLIQNSVVIVGDTGAITGAASVNKVAITAPATSATLTIADGKTLTVSNSLTLAGTDSTVMTFPATTATIARTDAANTFTGVQTMTSAALTTPVLSGTVTGTYTLGGTPTLASAAGVPYVAGVAAGYKVARGETALDGSNPTPVAHGLTTCIAFTATIKGTAAPGVGTSILTANINGANVDVYAWKVTANNDTTLIASTGTETFYWIAVGT